MNKNEKNQLISKKNEALTNFNQFFFTRAIDLLEDIIIEDDKDYKCFFLLGTSYLHINNLDISEKNLKISIKLNNKYYDSTHNLGVVYQLKKNYNDAINLFSKAIELKPRNLVSLTHLAEVYEKVKSFDKSKQYYEAILKIESRNLKANQGLARIYIKFGYHKQGLQFLQKSTGLIRFKDKNFEIIT